MNKEHEFLLESNKIEKEYSIEAFSNAVIAWEYAKNKGMNMDIDSVLKIHEILMKNINPAIAGKIRDCSIYIGGKCKDDTKQELRDGIIVWLNFLNNTKQTEEDIKRAHIEFEEIHPFEDGNGRVGRILMNVQRLNAGLPILVIHEGTEQTRYYRWFND